MYKKVSVVLGALALMVAIGFSASQSSAKGHKMNICHFGSDSDGQPTAYSIWVSKKNAGPAHVANHVDRTDPELPDDFQIIEDSDETTNASACVI